MSSFFRLMAISTGFVLALLTQRALLTEGTGFYAPMAALFENPGFAWTSDKGQRSGGMFLPQRRDKASTSATVCTKPRNPRQTPRHTDQKAAQPPKTAEPQLGTTTRAIMIIACEGLYGISAWNTWCCGCQLCLGRECGCAPAQWRP